MAPNQKHKVFGSYAVEGDLLSLFVRDKGFPPLTSSTDDADEVEEEEIFNEHVVSAVPQASVANVVPPPSRAYWAWETTGIPERKMETTQDLFSAESIESRLVAESQRLAATLTEATTVRAGRRHGDHEGYWDGASGVAIQSEGNRAVSEGTGYWNWPQDARGPIVALILKEEYARQQVSGRRMEERLVEDLHTKRHHLDQSNAENDSYWNWETSTPVYAVPASRNESYWEWHHEADPSPSDVIAAILKYEANRELLSIGHILETETKEETLVSRQREQCLVVATTHNRNESDAYWSWTALHDGYWNWESESPPKPALSPEELWLC